MRHVAALGIALGLLLSCSDGSQSDQVDGPDGGTSPLAASTCGKPAGAYQVAFRETSGTCGPQTSLIVNLPSDTSLAVGTFGPGCTGSSTTSDLGCTYDVSATCVGQLTPAEVTLCNQIGGCRPPRFIYRAHTKWDPALAGAKGTWSLDIQRDIGKPCSSTDEAVVTRL